MEFLNIEDKKACEEYERFVNSHKNGSFTQSLRWASVKKNWKHEAIVTRGQNGAIAGTVLVLIKPIPLLGCSFLYAPHGPVCDFNDPSALRDLFKGVRLLASQYHAYEFRMDPYLQEDDEKHIALLKDFGFQIHEHAPELDTIQVRQNYVLPIQGKSEEEIFASFHRKWRYNIRLAKRKGVTCMVCGQEHLPDFYRLMKETGKRDGFCIRKERYFRRMLEALGEYCRLYLCFSAEGEPLSGAIAIQFSGKTCYVYGASSDHHRNLMPNYLMQWEMIRWAVHSGCECYDFQGIPFYQDENHPNYGVYQFKKGFHGKIIVYAGEFYQTFSEKAKHTVNEVRKTLCCLR